MKKEKIIKDWISFNMRYWQDLKHRSKLHGHIENSDILPNKVMAHAEPIFVLSTGRVGTMLLTKLFIIGCLIKRIFLFREREG